MFFYESKVTTEACWLFPLVSFDICRMAVMNGLPPLVAFGIISPGLVPAGCITVWYSGNTCQLARGQGHRLTSPQAQDSTTPRFHAVVGSHIENPALHCLSVLLLPKTILSMYTKNPRDQCSPTFLITHPFNFK